MFRNLKPRSMGRILPTISMMDYEERAEIDKRLPPFIGYIPDELSELGEVFFPIPTSEKGHTYPHHLDKYRHSAMSPILNAYFEAGWQNYGIACAGSLAVVDIDDLDYVEEITSQLPETLYQMTGSRSGYHLFYFVPGLENRINLYDYVGPDCDCEVEEDYPEGGECDHKKDSDNWKHIGEVKCDKHGYVVGPRSLHPSGNRYGPLEGDTIVELEKEVLEDAVAEYQKPSSIGSSEGWSSDHDADDFEGPRNEFYELSPEDVLPTLKRGKRVGHPVHGSTTDSNFMMTEDGSLFMCWRCQVGANDGCALNAQQYLAVEATNMDCEQVRYYWDTDPTLHYEAWKQAVDEGLVNLHHPPYRVILGYGVDTGAVEKTDRIGGGLYFDLRQELVWETKCDGLPRFSPE